MTDLFHLSTCPAYNTKGRENESAPCACGARQAASLPREPRLPSLPKIPDRGREMDTARPPESESQKLMRLLEETSAAAANLGALVIELRTAVACTQLALLTEEHKANHAHDRIDGFAADFGKLAERVTALELAGAAE